MARTFREKSDDDEDVVIIGDSDSETNEEDSPLNDEPDNSLGYEKSGFVFNSTVAPLRLL